MRCATLMRRLQELVVDLPTVMDQPTPVLGSQNRCRLAKSPPRENRAEGDLFGDHRPQPAQLRFYLPTGLIHMRHHTAPRRIPQRMPGGFGFARHALDRPANPAPAHRQSKPCCKMAAASACGNPWALFISTPKVTASGPICTAAAPRASEVCS